nr:unnamed protein product [Callosobruchus chinensis]
MLFLIFVLLCEFALNFLLHPQAVSEVSAN